MSLERDVGPRRRLQSWTPYLFLSPWLVGMVVFFLIPLVILTVTSFTDFNLLSGRGDFVGVDNYTRMADDYRFWLSIRITLFYLVLSVPLYLLFGLGGALLLNQRVWGIGAFRTILFMPSVLSGVAVSVLWLQLLNPSNGAVNTTLRSIGIDNPPGWFSDPAWAVPGLVLSGLWGILGNGAIIYLAGLQNIPASLVEASQLDGAGVMRRFRHITLPLLTPTLFFMLLTSVIGALQVFDTAYTISGGSGGSGGESLLFYLLLIFNTGFQQGQLGYASALSWVLMLFGAAVVLLLMRTQDRWVHYGDND